MFYVIKYFRKYLHFLIILLQYIYTQNNQREAIFRLIFRNLYSFINKKAKVTFRFPKLLHLEENRYRYKIAAFVPCNFC